MSKARYEIKFVLNELEFIEAKYSKGGNKLIL